MLPMNAHKSLIPTTSSRASFNAAPSSPRTRSALAGKTIQAFMPPPAPRKVKGGACGCGGSCCKGSRPSTAKAVQAMQGNPEPKWFLFMPTKLYDLARGVISKKSTQCVERLAKPLVNMNKGCKEFCAKFKTKVDNDQITMADKYEAQIMIGECMREAYESLALKLALPHEAWIDDQYKDYDLIANQLHSINTSMRDTLGDANVLEWKPQVVAAGQSAVVDFENWLRHPPCAM